jgi:hypothetical protein
MLKGTFSQYERGRLIDQMHSMHDLIRIPFSDPWASAHPELKMSNDGH